jgi:hypothetical protein
LQREVFHTPTIYAKPAKEGKGRPHDQEKKNGLGKALVIEGLTLVFVDKASLLINKAAAGRPKDLADLEALS